MNAYSVRRFFQNWTDDLIHMTVSCLILFTESSVDVSLQATVRSHCQNQPLYFKLLLPDPLSIHRSTKYEPDAGLYSGICVIITAYGSQLCRCAGECSYLSVKWSGCELKWLISPESNAEILLRLSVWTLHRLLKSDCQDIISTKVASR